MPQTLKGTVKVEISAGELIDKLTILQIKAERIGDPDKRANVRIALQHLSRVRDEALSRSDELARLEENLKACNEKLWDIEDEIRNCEAAKEFGPRFIELARAVYQTNDRRARVKKNRSTSFSARRSRKKNHTRTIEPAAGHARAIPRLEVRQRLLGRGLILSGLVAGFDLLNAHVLLLLELLEGLCELLGHLLQPVDWNQQGCRRLGHQPRFANRGFAHLDQFDSRDTVADGDRTNTVGEDFRHGATLSYDSNGGQV